MQDLLAEGARCKIFFFSLDEGLLKKKLQPWADYLRTIFEINFI